MSTLIVKRTLLPLEQMSPYFLFVALVPFKVQGLAIWGAQAGDTVERIQIGPETTTAGVGSVPAQFYSMPEGWGYSALAAAIEAGDVLPVSYGPEYFLKPGTMFRLAVCQPDGSPADGIEVACWGTHLVAWSEEDLTDLPDDYFNLLVAERQTLRERMAQIDVTLERISKPGKSWITPTDEAPDSDPQKMTVSNWEENRHVEKCKHTIGNLAPCQREKGHEGAHYSGATVRLPHDLTHAGSPGDDNPEGD